MSTIIKSVRVAYPVGQSSDSWLTASGPSGQGWRLWPGTWEGLQGIHAVQQRGGKDVAEAVYFVPAAGVLSIHLEVVEDDAEVDAGEPAKRGPGRPRKAVA